MKIVITEIDTPWHMDDEELVIGPADEDGDWPVTYTGLSVGWLNAPDLAEAIKWGTTRIKTDEPADDNTEPGMRWYASTFSVFNAAQVDGWETPAPVNPLPDDQRNEQADRFYRAAGASIVDGTQAAYNFGIDRIEIPPFASFKEPSGYYATLAHEHGHWTGHETRLNRSFSGKFGDPAYALEELVAELSAAFTCAALGLMPVARRDHAAYLANWVSALKASPKILWSVASKAQAATDFLVKGAAAGGVDVREVGELVG